MDKAWLVIFIAGISEVIWAVCMGYSEGFTLWNFSLLTIIFLVISTLLLMKALGMGLPVGTAYAVWTGIGAVGTMTVSVFLGNESLTPLAVLFLVMVLGGIVGLHGTSKRTE